MSGASIRTTLNVSGSARAVGAEAAAAPAGGDLTCVDVQSGGACAVTSGGPNGGCVAFGGLWRRPQLPPGKRRLGIWQEGGEIHVGGPPRSTSAAAGRWRQRRALTAAACCSWAPP